MDAVRRLKDAMFPGNASSEISREVLGTVDHVGLSGAAWCLVPGNDDLVECAAPVTVHHGDVVAVSIVAGMLTITHNYTVPSVNDAGYEHVKDIAEEADELLDGVAEIAQQADKTLAEIMSDANASNTLVSGMQQTAQAAGTTLQQIVMDADSAASTLASMEAAAQQAGTTLEDIYQDAADAQTSAANAATAATVAQNKLSDVENVVGTLNWIAEHGTWTAATETAPVADRIYYTRTGSGTAQDPYEYTVVGAVGETDNPAALGWHYLVVDESVQAYLASHLWLDDYGLNLSVDSANGYRIHQGTVDGTKPVGTYIIDPGGNVVARFGATVALGMDGSSQFKLNAGSLQAYDSDGNLYFEVSESGLSFGEYAAATSEDVEEAISNSGLTRNFYPAPEYELTTDTEIDQGKTYYKRTVNEEGGYDYAPVAEPQASELATYYEAFPGTPAPPYGVGDTWTPGDGMMLVCIAAKDAGESYSAEDWTPADGTAEALSQLEQGIAQAKGELQNSIEATGNSLSEDMSAMSSDLNSRMESLEGDVSDASEWRNYMRFDQSTGLEIGRSDGNHSQVMDATGTHWRYSGEDAASVEVDEDGKGAMMLARSEVTEQMRVGNYVWFNRGNRLSLRYIPKGA